MPNPRCDKALRTLRIALQTRPVIAMPIPFAYGLDPSDPISDQPLLNQVGGMLVASGSLELV